MLVGRGGYSWDYTLGMLELSSKLECLVEC